MHLHLAPLVGCQLLEYFSRGISSPPFTPEFLLGLLPHFLFVHSWVNNTETLKFMKRLLALSRAGSGLYWSLHLWKPMQMSGTCPPDVSQVARVPSHCPQCALPPATCSWPVRSPGDLLLSPVSFLLPSPRSLPIFLSLLPNLRL